MCDPNNKHIHPHVTTPRQPTSTLVERKMLFISNIFGVGGGPDTAKPPTAPLQEDNSSRPSSPGGSPSSIL